MDNDMPSPVPFVTSTPTAVSSQDSDHDMESPAIEPLQIRGRGRGGRGRGGARRGRRGRGRGNAQVVARGVGRCLFGREERQEAMNLLELKADSCRQMVQNMSQDQMQELVQRMIEANPSLMLELIQAGPSPEPPPSSLAPGWCRCHHCREMSRDEEKVCCNNLPQNCISEKVEFRLLVLDRMVVELSNRHAADVWGYSLPHDNASARYAAYRQYTYWKHGRMGAGRLRVIPSCCVWKIRDAYPDPNQQYVGFHLRGGQLV